MPYIYKLKGFGLSSTFFYRSPKISCVTYSCHWIDIVCNRIIPCPPIKSTSKRLFLGCVFPPLAAGASSSNLGKTFLRNSVQFNELTLSAVPLLSRRYFDPADEWRKRRKRRWQRARNGSSSPHQIPTMTRDPRWSWRICRWPSRWRRSQTLKRRKSFWDDTQSCREISRHRIYIHREL